MNAILLTIILIPIIEIYLFIEISEKLESLYTISLIFSQQLLVSIMQNMRALIL